MLRNAIAASAFAILVSIIPATAHAQMTPDHRADVTFSQPVSLPGITLPAGTYQFRLVNPDSSHRIVQVRSADGSIPYAMLSTVPAERFEVSMTPDVRFIEAPRTVAWPIKVLWAPGAQFGWEFLYSPAQLQAIAQAARAPITTSAHVGPMVEPTPAATVVAQ